MAALPEPAKRLPLFYVVDSMTQNATRELRKDGAEQGKLDGLKGIISARALPPVLRSPTSGATLSPTSAPWAPAGCRVADGAGRRRTQAVEATLGTLIATAVPPDASGDGNRGKVVKVLGIWKERSIAPEGPVEKYLEARRWALARGQRSPRPGPGATDAFFRFCRCAAPGCRGVAVVGGIATPLAERSARECARSSAAPRASRRQGCSGRRWRRPC